MPIPESPRTGFEAYCKAAGFVFEEALPLADAADAMNDSPQKRFLELTPEIRFGAELFGYDRFFASSSTRYSTWGLKGTNKGRKNRFSVFQDLWLSDDTLEKLRELDEQIEDLQGRIKSVDALRKWRKGQSKLVERPLQVCGASRETYRSALTDAISNIATFENGLRDRQASESPALTEEHRSLLQDQLDWISALSADLEGIASEDASLADLRASLSHLDHALSAQEKTLRETKGSLSELKRPIVEEKARLEEACRQEAVGNCVRSMMSDESSLLWMALQEMRYGFANAFSTAVMPAIERGFLAEGYSESKVRGFKREMDSSANNLTYESGADSFAPFLTSLVRALVYGPETAGLGAGTAWEDEYELMTDEPFGSQVVLTQLLSPDGRFIGRTRVYDANDVIFLGRCDIVELYEGKLSSVIPNKQARDAMLTSKRLSVFPIDEEHGQVSNMHGAIICEDGAWRFLDFSKFGTRLVGLAKGADSIDVSFNNGYHELEAGNVIYLGARRDDADDERLHRKAAAVKFSYFFDEDNSLFDS